MKGVPGLQRLDEVLTFSTGYLSLKRHTKRHVFVDEK